MASKSLLLLAIGFQGSQVLQIVLKHSFADLLKDGPKSGDELARLANTHPENTERLLRAAVALGIFARDPLSLLFSLNETSSLLLQDAPNSLKTYLTYKSNPHAMNAWAKMGDAVESGGFPHLLANGMDFFSYLEQNPSALTQFNESMTGYAANFSTASALVANYNFQDIKHVVDIGGGHGAQVVEALRAFPHLIGTNFDLAHVIEDAKRKAKQEFSDVEGRLKFATGSFFESVPSDGDVYVLKQIVHDWNDEKALEILKVVTKCMPSHGKVVVIEQLIRDTDNPVETVMMDLTMMVLFNAKERTEKEFHRLFNSAGLKIVRIIPLPPSSSYVIEGEKM